MHTEHTQTSMPPVGFEPTIAVLERAKTVRALDRDRRSIKVCLITYSILLRHYTGRSIHETTTFLYKAVTLKTYDFLMLAY
jgi:hypothetical protein